MRADGSLRAVRAPRGLIVSTGEDVPRGQSLRARLLVPDIERQMLWWTANGFMKRTIPLRSIVDRSFVDEAAKAVPEQ